MYSSPLDVFQLWKFLDVLMGFGDAKVTWDSGDMNGLYTREHRVPWGFSHSFTFSYRFDLRWLDWRWRLDCHPSSHPNWTHNPCRGHDYTGWRMCLVNAPDDVKRSTGRQTEWVTWWKNSWHMWTTVSTQIPCICSITSNSSFLSPILDDFGLSLGDNPPILGSDWSGQGSRPLRGVIPGCCRSLLLPSSHTRIWRCCRYWGQLSEDIWNRLTHWIQWKLL